MILSRDVPVALATVPMVFNQDMKAIIARSDIDGEFLLYGLSAYKNRLRHEIGSAAHGTKRISTSAIENFRLPVPSLPDQQAIAHVLRTVQQAKEATERIIAAARQLKQSLMRHLFTYGPVPFDQADRMPVKETDHGEITEAWPIRALSECATVQRGLAKGRTIDTGEAVEVPYLRVANVQDGYLELAEIKTITIRQAEIARYSLQPGDIVLTEGGDFDKLGRGFIWNGQVPGSVHQNHIFAVRPYRAVLLPEFLAYLTQSTYGKSYFLSVAHKTTNLACINTTKLKALPVPLPSLEDQGRIVTALQAVDKKTEVETRKSRELDATFRTLLHNLMTGRLRVQGSGSGSPPG
jgi:type I restriction enzyme S subunit